MCLAIIAGYFARHTLPLSNPQQGSNPRRFTKIKSLEWAENPVAWCTAILIWLLEKLTEEVLNIIKEFIMKNIANIIRCFTTCVISAAIAGLGASLNARGAIKRSLCEKCPN